MRGGQWPHKERTRTSPFYWLGVLLSADHHDKVATLLSHTNTYEAKHSYRKQDKQIAGAAGRGKSHLSSLYLSLPGEDSPKYTRKDPDFGNINIQHFQKPKNCFTPLAPFVTVQNKLFKLYLDQD